MTAYIDFPLVSIVDKQNSEIVDKLLKSDRVSGFTQVSQSQIAAWHVQLDLLRHVARTVREEDGEAARQHLVLEYRIPRREKRADAIILLDRTIVLIEFKVGSLAATSADIAQILDYALDIAYYHAESRGRRLAPVLCATGMKGEKSGPSSDVPPIAPLTFCGSETLREVLSSLREADRRATGAAIVPSQWIRSRYQPIPGVIEAAVELFRAHEVADIKWVAARDAGFADWRVICSPVAAQLAGIDATHDNTFLREELDLGVPVRAHRAAGHARWVDAVLSGRPDEARQCVDMGALPVYLTRDIEKARDWLERTTWGTRRCGLLACSNGTRLRPYGVEVSTEFRKGIDYPSWFTEDRGNLRSSYALEVTATEFECQGLELDRVALCWSWDMPIIEGRPTPRVFRGGKWLPVRDERDGGYARNKYRVLLTRAREAMVIWVPKGRGADPTRNPGEADEIAAYLMLCGVQELIE